MSEFRDGYEAAKRAAVAAVEARRQRILADPSDPSWTEHMAELQGEIMALDADAEVVKRVLED